MTVFFGEIFQGKIYLKVQLELHMCIIHFKASFSNVLHLIVGNHIYHLSDQTQLVFGYRVKGTQSMQLKMGAGFQVFNFVIAFVILSCVASLSLKPVNFRQKVTTSNTRLFEVGRGT